MVTLVPTTMRDYLAPLEVNTTVRDVKVACDGGGGALGHPKVYINLDKKGPHACIYCGLMYEYAHDDEEEEKIEQTS